MGRILVQYLCSIGLIGVLHKFGILSSKFFVAFVLKCFKDIFNKCFIKINIIVSTLNLMCMYQYLSISVNFLIYILGHGVEMGLTRDQ
jgi:hypothetical protein